MIRPVGPIGAASAFRRAMARTVGVAKHWASDPLTLQKLQLQWPRDLRVRLQARLQCARSWAGTVLTQFSATYPQRLEAVPNNSGFYLHDAQGRYLRGLEYAAIFNDILFLRPYNTTWHEAYVEALVREIALTRIRWHGGSLSLNPSQHDDLRLLCTQTAVILEWLHYWRHCVKSRKTHRRGRMPGDPFRNIPGLTYEQECPGIIGPLSPESIRRSMDELLAANWHIIPTATPVHSRE